MLKTCRKCQKEKQATDFQKSPRNKGGLATQCKECQSAEAKAKRAANPELAKARRRAGHLKRKALNNAYSSAYYLANKERMSALRCARYLADKERSHEQTREWRDRNPERARETSAIYYAENRARLIAAAKARKAADPERAKTVQHAKYLRHKAAHFAHARLRRARKAAAEGRFTAADVEQMTAEQRGRCACCRLRLNGKFHVDHIKPLNGGGTNWRRNLQLLCPPCNLSKGAKDPIAFMQSRGFLL